MDTQNRETSLRTLALAAHERELARNRERAEQRAQEEEADRRAFVSRWLSAWLGHAVPVEALPFTIDDLTFTAHRYTAHGWSEWRLFLLWECPGCHENTAAIAIGTDYQLGAFLAAPQPDPCPGCTAEEEEFHRQQPHTPPAPPLSVEDRLTAAIRDLIESRLEERDEAESTRDYYRSEREARARQNHADELHRLEEQHRTDTYRLEDDLRRTQDQLKRQQRGW